MHVRAESSLSARLPIIRTRVLGNMPLPTKMLANPRPFAAFCLATFHFSRKMPAHTKKLTTLVHSDVLTASINSSTFCGLEEIPNAIDNM
ncbi:hypothetical protein CCR75_008323 [Bremia lactucae]|uniref:Uncharacterized protein n=1 Tax=Bremia lactucae TaxID=4779 RepID=A0A976IDG7_BRELC|nr:hypothetical protein CCR75_008323 [Bremia lactucae]